MPILGVVASSISGHLTPPYSTNFYSIQTITVDSGGASSITFSSIPQTYTHLQIRSIARKTGASYDQIRMQYNSDTGNNYNNHILYGDGSAAVYTNNGSGSNLNWTHGGIDTGTSQSSGVFGTNIIDILDYTNTNKYKVNKIQSGVDNNGSGLAFLPAGVWFNTNAITSITITPNSDLFGQYSQFALYGVK